MDLLAIGSHCALSSCNELDFLPIRCGSCEKFYCRHHISPDTHPCSFDTTTLPNSTGCTSFEKLQRCALDTCPKPSLEAYLSDSSDVLGRSAATCSRCRLSFCVDHRYPEFHSCSAKVLPSQNKNEAGQALLAKHFPPSSSSKSSLPGRSAKISSNSKKQYNQVELMKMRHRAIPGDPKDKGSSVPVDQRLHVKVRADGVDSQERVIWFRKAVGTGKALDLLASHLGMVYSDSSPLRLSKVSNDTISHLRNDQQLNSQVEEGSMLVIGH